MEYNEVLKLYEDICTAIKVVELDTKNPNPKLHTQIVSPVASFRKILIKSDYEMEHLMFVHDEKLTNIVPNSHFEQAMHTFMSFHKDSTKIMLHSDIYTEYDIVPVELNADSYFQYSFVYDETLLMMQFLSNLYMQNDDLPNFIKVNISYLKMPQYLKIKEYYSDLL